MWPEVAHWMGLIPLLTLAAQRLRGVRVEAVWWWCALVFGISWLADTAAHWIAPDLVGNLYPLSQAALIGALCLPRPAAWGTLIGLTLAALFVVWQGSYAGVDVAFRFAAWGLITGCALYYPLPPPIRAALLLTFAAGLVTWSLYAVAPSWPTWGAYQTTRAVGIVVFSLGAWRWRIA